MVIDTWTDGYMDGCRRYDDKMDETNFWTKLEMSNT